jgi:hypothetical protein
MNACCLALKWLIIELLKPEQCFQTWCLAWHTKVQIVSVVNVRIEGFGAEVV